MVVGSEKIESISIKVSPGNFSENFSLATQLIWLAILGDIT
jgi:hypothetical protein